MSDIYLCDAVREVRRLHCDLSGCDLSGCDLSAKGVVGGRTDSLARFAFSSHFAQLPVREQLDLQAKRILDGHRAGNYAVVTHVTNWHPEMVGASAEEVMKFDLQLNDARVTIAREYGFVDWEDAQTRGCDPSDARFELAVDTLLQGDTVRLAKSLAASKSLIHQRSAFGHRSTLLHYCGSNGVETYRQVVPMNLAEIVAVLIDAGADVNATAEMYGGGCTAIDLLLSSAHPRNAGVLESVAQMLKDSGSGR